MRAFYPVLAPMGLSAAAGYTTGKSLSVQFGVGGPTVVATFSGSSLNWSCTGTVPPSIPWGAWVQLTIRATASFRFMIALLPDEFETLSVTSTLMVRLPSAIVPTINPSPFTSPIVAPTLPLGFVFTGSATSPQAPIVVVQY